MPGLWFVFFIPLVLMSLATEVCHAITANLPYTNRTRSYSGWPATVHGDIETIGMAGAMVGLGNSFVASADNPAGLAMTLDSTGITFNSDAPHDGLLQDYDNKVEMGNVGAYSNIYPWGVSLGYWTPYREGQYYALGPTGQMSRADIAVHEMRFSLARVLFDNKLALGGGVSFGQATRELDLIGSPDLLQETKAYGVGGTLGAMYQLPKRWLLGASYSFPVTYAGGKESTLGITNFNQSVKTPYRLKAGVGWIPNRNFHAGFGLYLIGATDNAALLGDDGRLAGQHATIQPRIGATYTVAEFKDLKAYLSAGSYFETTRIESKGSRLHATVGIEFNIWIFNLGWAVDESRQYENYIYSLGFDLVRLMRKMDLVPESYHPPYAGIFPSRESSDEGLPRTLSKHWDHHEKEGPGDILQITKDIPKRFKAKIMSIKDGIAGKSDEVPADTRPFKHRGKKNSKNKKAKPSPPPETRE